MALLEKLKENDQLLPVEEIAGRVPAVSIEYEQMLGDGGTCWDDVNGGDLPEDLVLAARREIMHGYILKVSEKSFHAKVYRCKQAAVGSDLGGHRQVCGSSSQENAMATSCRRIQDEIKRQNSTNHTSFTVVLCNSTS